LAGDAVPYILRPAISPSCRRAVPTPAGADDQRGLAGPDTRDAVQDLLGDQVVEDERAGCHRVDVVGHRGEIPDLAVDDLSVAVEAGERRHSIPRGDLGDIVADSVDDSDEGVPGHVRRPTQERPVADADGYVVLADGRGQDPDPRLARRRGPAVPLDDPDLVQAAPPRHGDALVRHGLRPRPRRSRPRRRSHLAPPRTLAGPLGRTGAHHRGPAFCSDAGRHDRLVGSALTPRGRPSSWLGEPARHRLPPGAPHTPRGTPPGRRR
jgi:hypothetical protein